MKTIHLLIKGKVQGVFYRATAKDIAKKTGITGWIRNTENGDVEATITGSEHQLEAFANWCRQGPSGAKVSEVIITEQEEKAFDGFNINK